MALVDLALPLVGAGLLALLLTDVYLTVFDPGGRSGPLHEWKNRAVWHAFRGVARHLDNRHASRVRVATGPVLAAVTVVAWLGLLVVSFAFIYYPFVLGFAFTATPATSRLTEAIYYSAMATSTMGLGDVVAHAAWLRLLTSLEAMLGFALFSASITYILSTFREIVHPRTLALHVAGLFADGAPPLTESEWQRDLVPPILRVTQGFVQFPVLRHFQAATAERSALVQLGRVLAHVETARQETLPPEVRTANGALRRALDRFIREMHDDLVPPRFEGGYEDDDLQALHARILRYQLMDRDVDPALH